MKLIALTAALALGTAAYAQDMSTQAPAGDAATTTQTAPAEPAPAAPPPPAGDTTMQQQPMAGATGETPKGGYMPSTPPLSGTPTAGATVRVQPSMSPAQAFPPPAPKAEYPVCKRGQTDGCRQRGG